MQDFINDPKHLAEIIQLKEHPQVEFNVDLQAVAAKQLNLTDGQTVIIHSVEMLNLDQPLTLKIRGRITYRT